MEKTAIKLVLWAATAVVVAAYSPALARGQTHAIPPAAGVPAGVGRLNGLMPEQMGQVGNAPPDGTGTAIAPVDVDVMSGIPELPVAGAAAAALAPPPPGTIDHQVLSEAIAARLEPLEECRIAVARRKHVVASDVAADRLTLRWIIAKTGRAFGAEVVAATPTDDGVLDCIKRQMADWTFPPPSGGPIPIERDFTFRAAPPAR